MLTFKPLFAGAVIAGLMTTASGVSAATILFEDFEDSTLTYVPSAVDDVSDIGNSDYYGRVTAADLPSSVSYTGAQGSGFYSAQDTDGATIEEDEITLSFSGIDVSSFTNLNLSFLLAEDDSSDGEEDWDGDTSFIVSYQIDGGGFTNGFAVEAERPGGAFFNSTPLVDTDFDGDGDGTALTDVFSQFDFDIADGGILDLRFTLTAFTAGDEDIAIDSILLSGDNVAAVPLPAGIWLLGAALGGLGLARRKA